MNNLEVINTTSSVMPVTLVNHVHHVDIVDTSSSLNSGSNDKVAPFDLAKTFVKRAAKKLKKYVSKKRNGYVLIALVFFYWFLGFMLTIDIAIITTKQVRQFTILSARHQSQMIGVSLASPIRNYINGEVKKVVQQQHIEHLAANRSSAETYQCQGSLVATMANGGDLKQQFGLCDPKNLLNGLTGKVNQTVDFLSFLYPNHTTPLADPVEDKRRRNMIAQYENTYQYSLKPFFVSQEPFFENGVRHNRYRYLVRAEMESITWFNLTNHMVYNFDVVVEDNYIGTPFNGVGNNCDQIDYPDNPPTGPDLVVINPDGTAIVCDDGVDCQPIGYTDSNGVTHPFGSPQYNQACGTLPSGQADPYCTGGLQGSLSTGPCTLEGGANYNCPTTNGGFFNGVLKSSSVRATGGCASINSNKFGRTEPDPDGYTFIVFTRVSTIGNTSY